VSYVQVTLSHGVLVPPPSDPWNIDQYRCAERDGEGDRCQLVIGHDGQHVLQRAGQRLTWPIGAEPQTRRPWATTFPRDETR
jgi:hypothetical protein